MKMELKFKKLHPDAILPTYAHDGDAGMDLYSLDDYIVESGEVTAVRTGMAVEIPDGYVGLVHPRSGLAFKEGVTVVNAPGTIDAGYRGEIRVALTTVNWLVGWDDSLYRDSVVITNGDRIAQLVIQKVERAEIVEVDELSEHVRGEAGFGSTGA
jgi:dUTP pyrophosphatase